MNILVFSTLVAIDRTSLELGINLKDVYKEARDYILPLFFANNSISWVKTTKFEANVNLTRLCPLSMSLLGLINVDNKAVIINRII